MAGVLSRAVPMSPAGKHEGPEKALGEGHEDLSMS